MNSYEGFQNLQISSSQIEKLRSSFLSLSTQLQGEIVLRRDEDEKIHEEIKKQYEDIRNFTDNLSQIGTQMNDIRENVFRETGNLIEGRVGEVRERVGEVENKIEGLEKIIENINSSINQSISSIIKNEIEPLISQQISSSNNTFLVQINNLNQKIMFLETEFSNSKEKICLLENNINILKNNQEDIKNIIGKIFKEIENIGGERREEKINKSIIKERIENLEDRIIKINSIQEENNNANMKQFNDVNSSISSFRISLLELTDTLNRDVGNLLEKYKRDSEIRVQEQTRFEKHFATELDKFTKYITGNLNSNNKKIKALNECLKNDVALVKEKNSVIEQALYRLREEAFGAMEESSKLLMKKMEG